MAEKMPQTYDNHARFVPVYHYAMSLILLVNLGWSIWKLIGDFSFDTVLGVLMAATFIGMFYYLRTFPLTVQDRLIRLEMRLRLAEVLPDDLKPRIDELTVDQHVGLRFASDEELPELVRAALDEKLGRGEIKKRIKTWVPDYVRC